MKKSILFIVFIFTLFLVGCLTMSSDVCADVDQLVIEKGLSWEQISTLNILEGVYFSVDSKPIGDCKNFILKHTGLATNTNCISCHRGLTDWLPFKQI